MLTSFRRERQKEGTTSSMGRDEVYHSAWFAFRAMAFLNDKFQPRKTQNTLQVSFFLITFKYRQNARLQVLCNIIFEVATI